jgi:hypothetical protein
MGRTGVRLANRSVWPSDLPGLRIPIAKKRSRTPSFAVLSDEAAPRQLRKRSQYREHTFREADVNSGGFALTLETRPPAESVPFDDEKGGRQIERQVTVAYVTGLFIATSGLSKGKPSMNISDRLLLEYQRELNALRVTPNEQDQTVSSEQRRQELPFSSNPQNDHPSLVIVEEGAVNESS